MCSEVIQPAVRRHAGKSPQPTVNNFAATKFAPEDKSSSGRIAPRRRRSRVANLTKVQLRTPPGVAARSQTSERTSPREGPNISTTLGRPTMHKKDRPMISLAHNQPRGGLDWPKDHKKVVTLDGNGPSGGDLVFQTEAVGWERY